MPLNADISAALQLLEHIQASIEHGDDPKLQAHTADDLQLLISVLENPILRSIVNIQDSLGELNVQLQQHPSLLPVDFDINPSGDLVLSLPAGGPPSVDLYPGVGPTTPFEVDDSLEADYDIPAARGPDDQRVPVAKLSHSSSGDTVSPPSAAPMADGSLGGAPPPILPPITTPTYALEFKRAVEESSQGRQILTVKLFKPDGASLGFSVVGLRSEERGELGIFVQEIQAQGIAGRNGSLHEGDQIIAIDGQPLDSNISHQQAISILHEARGPVELVVARASVPPPLIAAAAAAAAAAASAAVAASAAAAAASSASNHSNNADQSQQSTVAALPPTPLSASSSSAAVSALATAGQRTPTNSVIPGLAEPNKAEMVLNTEWAQVEIIDLVNDGSGLGFGIIGGRSTGVVVKTILPGGVADRDGRLQSGDHILQIGEVNLRGMGSEQVAAVLRQSGSRVRLVVARPVEPSSPDYQSLGSHAPIVPTKILSDPDELDRHLVQNGYPEAFRVPLDDDDSPDTEGLIGGVTLYPDTEIDFHSEPGLVVDVVRAPGAPPLPTLTLDLASAVADGPLPEMDTFTVELRKDLHGLGITIAGYVCEKEELSGIFVKSISEGSAADLCKKIQVNDRIVEVDGRSLQGYTNHQAVEVLRATGQTVILRLERYLRGPKYEQLQLAIANSELKPPTPGSPSASATSLPRFPISTDGEDETEIVLDGESHTTVDSLILEGTGGIICYDDSALAAASLVNSSSPDDPLIDCNYTGMLRPEVEAAIRNKWMSVLGGPDVEIVVAQICKFEKGGGLGISLEGTVDVEDGQEVRPHHYIRSILPDGPVGQNRRLNSGDELLEVNGHRLLGMNHIEVVTILKELPVYVRMVCARRSGDVAVHRLIDTSQDRAAFAARSLLGGSLQNLIPATDRLVKAKSDGSLASTTTTATATETSLGKMKSRSLEPLTGLAMWSSEPQVIELTKGDGGLGFSILDYQDPMNPNETVIVIRSLVPGGVAKLDGRLIPGDRLLFVNDIALENASLDQAVQALKGAPRGVVRIGVAKPLPIPDSLSQSQDLLDALSQTSPTLDDQVSLSSCSLSPSEDEAEAEVEATATATVADDVTELVQDHFPDHDSTSTAPVGEQQLDSPLSESSDEALQLPGSLEIDIKIRKGVEALGVSLEAAERAINGLRVAAVATGGAVARDSRIVPGDWLVSVNNEVLRGATHAQARAILARAQLLTPEISVAYIPGEVSTAYRRSFLSTPAPETPQPPQISPRVFPDYYRSPYISSDSKPPHSSSVSSAIAEENPLFEDNSEPPLPPVPETTSGHRDSKKSHDSRDSREDREWDTHILPQDYEPVSEPEPKRTVLSEIVASVGVSGVFSDGDDGLTTGDEDPDDTEMTISQSTVAMDSTSKSDILLAKHWGPERCVEVEREPNCSLGISIVGGKVDLYNAGSESGSAISGIFIKNVLPQSPAGKSGDLKTGDRILEVDGVDLRQASHERAVAVIRAAGSPVRFLVQSLVHWAAAPPPPLDVPKSTNTSTVVVATQVAVPPPAGGGPMTTTSTTATATATTTTTIQPPAPPSSPPTPSDVADEAEPVAEIAAKPESKQDVPATVEITTTTTTTTTITTTDEPTEKVAASQPETSSNTDSVPRRTSVKLKAAMSAVASASANVFTSTPPKTPKTKTSPVKKAVSKYSSDEEDSDEDEVDDSRLLEGKIRTKKGQQIYRASAGNVRRSKEEAEKDPEEEDEWGYTKNKVKKKYGPGALVAVMERGPGGLGLSLSGHKDRSRMAVLVCGLNPAGVASRAGCVRLGDEILEVNGVVLQGRCHLNASAIIKGLPGPTFKVILLRKDTAIDDLAVKPITQFPVTLDDETPEERYSNFKGLRTVTIKKGNQGLGIMIIEGKHADLGQGIFVSDIQEGSAAEQAGLVVGDMILAVNKDTLLGADYDSAASLLKKTEGVVSLVVCNPAKAKEVSTNDETNTTTNPSATSNATTGPVRSPTPTTGSRAVTPTPGSEKPRLFPKPLISALIPHKSPTLSSRSTTSVSPTPTSTPTHRQTSTTSTITNTTTTTTTMATSVPPTDPALDPATCAIAPGKETTVEINKDRMGLGLSIVGGSDTLLGAIIIHEVYGDGAAARDGRLKPGDQIIEVNHEDFRSITHGQALAALRQTPAKVRMIVSREEPSTRDDELLEIHELELIKKPGKGLGLSIVGRRHGPGVFISDVVTGGAADADGRLMKGDQILSVNGQCLKTVSQEDAAAVLKTTTGRVTIKLGRLRPILPRKFPPAAPPGDRLEAAAATNAQSTVSFETSSNPDQMGNPKRTSIVRHLAKWSFRRRNL